MANLILHDILRALLLLSRPLTGLEMPPVSLFGTKNF